MGILGAPIRFHLNPSKALYLTFDDGPNAIGTPEVLKVLEGENIFGTFFVVASKAQQNRTLLLDIKNRGHSVGNHSLDHRYRNFFKSKTHMLDWIKNSEEILTELLGHPTVGFRPPSGIRTPKLAWALRELDMPLILWNKRFYDTVFSWDEKGALNSLKSTPAGSIVLLHDRQDPKRLPQFLTTLREYIREAKKEGFTFLPLPS